MILLDLLFPRRCVGCGRLGSYICPDCRKTLVLQPQLCSECGRPAIDGATHPACRKPLGLDGLTTIFSNRSVIKRAIKVLKYRLVSDLAETLINLIPEKVLANLPTGRGDLVVYPIPLHKERLKWRGFNQAGVLGKYLAKRLKLNAVDGLLIRKMKRVPQADIAKREDRIKNAQGLFIGTTKLEATKPLNILLVDDVWTTGATMKEAAKVLKRNEVSKVWGLTLAR